MMYATEYLIEPYMCWGTMLGELENDTLLYRPFVQDFLEN